MMIFGSCHFFLANFFCITQYPKEAQTLRLLQLHSLGYPGNYKEPADEYQVSLA
jgi:hypothetical protein